MANGTHKPIDKVRVGDRVTATDPTAGRTQPQTVLATISSADTKNLVQVTVDTDGRKGNKTSSITATDNHSFWIQAQKQWLDAAKLRPGMWLRTSAGTHVQINKIATRTQYQRVHNFTVDVDHTYYVVAGSTAVFVHNCPASTGGGKPGFFRKLFGGRGAPARPEANGTVGDLRGILHDNVDDNNEWISDTLKKGLLKDLDDHVLLKAIFEPDDKHRTYMAVHDGVMVEGNHRMAELLKRAADPNYRIDYDTPIFVGW